MKEKLTRLRKEKGLLLKDVAKALDMSVSAYSNYEQGLRQPSNEILKKICSFFNVTSDYLLDLEDEFGNKLSDTPASTEEPKKIKLPVAARSKGNKLRNVTLELTEEQLNKLIAEIKGE